MIPSATRASLLFAVAGLAAGCAHYTAAPISLDALPRRVASVRLDEKPAGTPWTSAELLAAALSRNPAAAEAAARYHTARAAAKAARVAPSITLTLTAEYANDPSASSNWLYGVGSDIPLDIGARRATRVTAADLAAAQARYDYGEALWTVRTALRRAIVERQAADAELGLARQWVELRRRRAERLDRRVAAGEDELALALTAHGDLNAADRRVSEAQGRRAAADATLAQALGASPAAVRDLVIEPDSAAPDLADLPARRHAAALNRRDVLKAVIDYDLAENALRLEVARQYPEIRLGPGYTWERGLTKLPFNLSLVLPQTDLNRAAIAQAEAKRVESGRALEAIQASALGAIDQAQAAVLAARAAQAKIAGGDLPTAQRLALAATRSAQAGESDRVDALQADAAVIEAQLALGDARKASALAIVDLEDGLRAPLVPAETAILDQSLKTLGATP